MQRLRLSALLFVLPSACFSPSTSSDGSATESFGSSTSGTLATDADSSEASTTEASSSTSADVSEGGESSMGSQGSSSTTEGSNGDTTTGPACLPAVSGRAQFDAACFQ